MSWGDLQYEKDWLMGSIIYKWSTVATHNNRSHKMLKSTPPSPIRLKLAQPPGLSRHRSAFNTETYKKSNHTKHRRRRRKKYQLVLKRSTVQQLRITWWSNTQSRCKQLLDRKRSAVSVVTGAAQTIKTTQRQRPAKRRKWQWQKV